MYQVFFPSLSYWLTSQICIFKFQMSAKARSNCSFISSNWGLSSSNWFFSSRNCSFISKRACILSSPRTARSPDCLTSSFRASSIRKYVSYWNSDLIHAHVFGSPCHGQPQTLALLMATNWVGSSTSMQQIEPNSPSRCSGTWKTADSSYPAACSGYRSGGNRSWGSPPSGVDSPGYRG